MKRVLVVLGAAAAIGFAGFTGPPIETALASENLIEKHLQVVEIVVTTDVGAGVVSTADCGREIAIIEVAAVVPRAPAIIRATSPPGMRSELLRYKLISRPASPRLGADGCTYTMREAWTPGQKVWVIQASGIIGRGGFDKARLPIARGDLPGV